MAEIPLWQSRFLVPAAAVEAFLDALDDEFSVAAFEDAGRPDLWGIALIHQGEPDRAALLARLAPIAAPWRIDLEIAPIPSTDWLHRAAESFPPQRIGRFWIHGSHIAEPPPVGSVPIRLDAGQAFGSGEHESTRGCLLALDRLARHMKVRRALDVGCGTGVLAIAVAMAWAKPVVATDIDPVSARFTENAARQNSVGRFIATGAGPGLRPAVARDGAPYDLICANILARPLARLAPAIAGALAPQGRVVLSGLLWWQEAGVLAAYRAQGLPLKFRVALGGWRTLVVGRS